MIDLLIYGTGNNATKFIELNFPKSLRIVGFIEGIKSISEFYGYTVIHPNHIKEYSFDYIFVSVSENNEIIEDLRNIYSVPPDKIIDCDNINNLILNIALNNYKFVMISDGEDYLNEPYDYMVNDFFLFKLFPYKIFAGKKWIIENDHVYTRVIIIRSHIWKKLLLNRLFENLKEKLKSVKFVLILSDMVKGTNGYEHRLESYFDFYHIKNQFDLIITYHKYEAKKLNIMYFQQPFHKINMQMSEKLYDVIFVGNSKDRFEMLYQAFIYFEKNDIRSLFYINDVPEEKIINHYGIVYNSRLPYIDYLQLVNESNCIFETCYESNVSSMRFAEAVVYNKKLLTNDESIKTNSLYNDKYMKVYSKITDIDINFIKSDININYNYEDQFEFDNLIDIFRETWNI